MKTVYTPLILVTICLTFILNSCQSTIEIAKRKYNPGYHVSFVSGKENKSTPHSNLQSSDLKSINEQIAVLPYHAMAMKIPTMSADKTISCSQEVKSTYASSKNLNQIKSIEPMFEVQKMKKRGESPKRVKKLSHSSGLPVGLLDEIAMVLLIILAFIFPPLAVGLASDWDVTKLLISILLSIFFWVPGVIYALFVILTGA